MSAFFVAINRRTEAIDPAVAENMLAPLRRFGRDGEQLVVQSHFAFGHQRAWSVPEEVGERQPLYDAQTGWWLLFHGRLDNRAHLHSRLATAPDASISDAALLMALFLAQGESILPELTGPFVLVLFHPSEQRLLAARDVMGGRYLVSHVSDDWILLGDL